MTAVFKIDNTSEIFLLIGYTITARETRHRSGSVSYEYTDIPKNKRKTQPKRNPYNFMPAVPFGGEKKGERERCVKGLPERDAQEFLKNILFQVFKIAARL